MLRMKLIYKDVGRNEKLESTAKHTLQYSLIIFSLSFIAKETYNINRCQVFFIFFYFFDLYHILPG